MEEEFEYIVVGSGAGGGPVAANLAQAGHRVLLLEAGGAPESLKYQVPAFHPLASEDPEMSWQFFVRHYAGDEQQRRDSKYCPQQGGVFYPRAGTLGGCTAHNAMIFSYPQNSDWDEIAEITGDESWSAASMHRHFQKLEKCRYRRLERVFHLLFGRSPSRHGFAGWLTTCAADPLLLLEDRELLDAARDSAKKVLAGARNFWQRLELDLLTQLDPNDWRGIRIDGMGLRGIPLTVARGRRNGTRERLLAVKKAKPDKLTIRLGALATKVLFDAGRRAIGVAYLEGEHLYRADPHPRPANAGTPCQARASREVILAGGSFNTPALLQLSGIGPAPLLEKHGIQVLVDLPGVGKNLQDRYEVSVVLRMKKPWKLLEGVTLRPPGEGEKPDRAFRQWPGRGVYTTNGGVTSIIAKSYPRRPVPDLFLLGLVSDFRGYVPGYSQRTSEARQYFSWTILKAHTNNRAGRVAIRSPDPREPPDIDFHYFAEGSDPDGEDLNSVVRGVEYARAITKSFSHLVEEEVVPGEDFQTPEEIRQFVRDEAWGHHASSSCKIGRADDPLAVLDSKFRVRGTKGLRVVDASVFPRIPGLFIVSSIYMIAEKASETILADA